MDWNEQVPYGSALSLRLDEQCGYRCDRTTSGAHFWEVQGADYWCRQCGATVPGPYQFCSKSPTDQCVWGDDDRCVHCGDSYELDPYTK